jgi:signal transduction histidine kinase
MSSSRPNSKNSRILKKTAPLRSLNVARISRSASSGQGSRFESLLGSLSAAFARVASDEINHEIGRWLKEIVVELGLDRTNLAEWLTEKGDFRNTFQWVRPGLPRAPMVLVQAHLPWITQRIRAGESVIFSSLGELPAEARRDKRFARKYGPKSSALFPLMIGEKVVAAMAFGSLTRECDWPEWQISRLRLVGDIFANALARRDQALEMRRLREEVAHGSRVVMLGHLAAALAHELNQPLAAILSNAQASTRLLSGPVPDLDETHGALRDIVQDCQRAGDVIRRVRSLFLKENRPLSAVDLTELLRETSRLLRADALVRRVPLVVEAPAELPKVRADRVQLQQVIINLAINAFDAVAGNGVAPRDVVIRAFQERPESVNVSVRDSGSGIMKRNLTRLFDPFFSTKPNGTGIGLAISKSIVESHGGRLWATPHRGRGTTLEFSIPVDPRGAQA